MNTQLVKKTYLLDTNILMGFSLWLPIRFNNFFWSQIANALQRGDWVLLDVVAGEIKQHNQELVRWCKEQGQKGLITAIEDSVRERGVEINNQYKMIDESTQKSTVDTYLIAYAEANNLIVFSREGPRRRDTDLYKIPDVCRILKVENIALPEKFMKAIGFQN